jgi:hypothetical protein
MSASAKISQRVADMTDRLATLKSRQLLRELQLEQRARELIRKRDARRRWEIGTAVLEAGFGDWHALEVVGALLDVKERIGDSPTQRLAVRIRAEGNLYRRRRPARGLPKPASEPDSANEPQDDSSLIAAMFDAEREAENS